VYYAAKRHEAEEICGDIDIFALVQATKRQNLGTSITFDTILRRMGDGQLFITGFANATPFTATICTAVHDAVAIGLEGP
jgi:hypothetical protein